MPQRYRDPATGRAYEVADDGTSRWVDDDPEPARPEPRFEPQTYAQPAPIQYPRPRARRGRFFLGLLVGLVVGAAAGAGAVALGGDGATTSTPSSAASTAPAAGRTTSTGERAFVLAYRQALPGLAAGRKDAALLDDARNTCLDVAAGKDAAALRKSTRARFTGQDGTVPSAAEADAIVALAKASVCG